MRSSLLISVDVRFWADSCHVASTLLAELPASRPLWVTHAPCSSQCRTVAMPRCCFLSDSCCLMYRHAVCASGQLPWGCHLSFPVLRLSASSSFDGSFAFLSSVCRLAFQWGCVGDRSAVTRVPHERDRCVNSCPPQVSRHWAAPTLDGMNPERMDPGQHRPRSEA